MKALLNLFIFLFTITTVFAQEKLNINKDSIKTINKRNEITGIILINDSTKIFEERKSYLVETLKKHNMHIEKNAQNKSTTKIFFRCKPTLDKINEPLYVINGIPFETLNFKKNQNEVEKIINPDEIESISIIKGENAVNLYGENAKNGAILITTKDISKRELKKLYKKYSAENSINKETDVFKISGTVYDCEKLELSGVYIKNLNSKAETQTDFDGKFSIEVKINDILEISFLQFISQKIKIENKENLIVNLKAEQQIMLEKPVIYLYPTEKTAIDIKLDLKGELLTTFPKYDKSWEVIAEPNGQIFDKKTNRYYSSLFWDGTIDFPSAHYKYDDGFIVSKDNLTEFLIKKLDHIGLNNQETNEFIQYWLPILERNKYNFIHFLVNEECNEIATLNVNPKPETSIRIYMEFYGLENRTIIKEQQLPKTERKGFTLVEWGGADVSSKIRENEF